MHVGFDINTQKRLYQYGPHFVVSILFTKKSSNTVYNRSFIGIILIFVLSSELKYFMFVGFIFHTASYSNAKGMTIRERNYRLNSKFARFQDSTI